MTAFAKVCANGKKVLASFVDLCYYIIAIAERPKIYKIEFRRKIQTAPVKEPGLNKRGENHEGRHPSELQGMYGYMRMRQYLCYEVNKGRTPPRCMLCLPSVLYGTAEIYQPRRPC